MTDLLEDLKAYFVANEVPASLVFRDAMPDKPDTAVALYEYQGVDSIAQVAGALRSVQIVSRAESATDAKLLARKLHGLLQTEDGDIELTEERWAIIHLRNPPFKLKTDESGRQYYVFNIGFTTYND